MLTSISARIYRTTMTGLVVAALGVGLFASAGAAHAEPKQILTEDRTECLYEGKYYPAGTIIKDNNGRDWMVCFFGEWSLVYNTIPVHGKGAVRPASVGGHATAAQ